MLDRLPHHQNEEQLNQHEINADYHHQSLYFPAELKHTHELFLRLVLMESLETSEYLFNVTPDLASDFVDEHEIVEVKGKEEHEDQQNVLQFGLFHIFNEVYHVDHHGYAMTQNLYV